MNLFNLTHTLTNTQVMPPRKGKWSLGKLTITLLQNQKFVIKNYFLRLFIR